MGWNGFWVLTVTFQNVNTISKGQKCLPAQPLQPHHIFGFYDLEDIFKVLSIINLSSYLTIYSVVINYPRVAYGQASQSTENKIVLKTLTL